MEKMQYVLIGISSVLLLWFLAPLFLNGILNIGNVTGIFLFGYLLYYGIFMHRIGAKIAGLWQRKAGKVILLVLAFVVAAAIIIGLVETIWMINATKNPPPRNTTAVVLGCKVNGMQPSRILAERIDTAYDYLIENPQAICVLSGGQGADEGIAEAQCMYEQLLQKGIEKERLLIEDQSTTTAENLKLSKELLKKQGDYKDITVITSEFHAYRATKTAERMGVSCYATSSHTSLLYLPTYYVRELYGILYYQMKH